MGPSDSVWCGARFIDRLQALAGGLAVPGAPPLVDVDGLAAEIPSTLSAADFATLRAVFITFVAKAATLRAVPPDRLTTALEVCLSSDATSFRAAAVGALAELGCFPDPSVVPFDPRVTQALRYIRRHATLGSTSVAVISSHVRLSRWHLERLIRRYTRKPLTAHIRDVRMSVARKMLRDTLLAVKEVAAETGYRSPSAFSRDFKRTSGVSPLAWRRGRTLGRSCSNSKTEPSRTRADAQRVSASFPPQPN